MKALLDRKIAGAAVAILGGALASCGGPLVEPGEEGSPVVAGALADRCGPELRFIDRVPTSEPAGGLPIFRIEMPDEIFVLVRFPERPAELAYALKRQERIDREYMVRCGKEGGWRCYLDVLGIVLGMGGDGEEHAAAMAPGAWVEVVLPPLPRAVLPWTGMGIRIGDHVTLGGRVEIRREGQVYLRLGLPIRVEGEKVHFVRVAGGRELADCAPAALYGMLELQARGGPEAPAQLVLTGVSNLALGEPMFDGYRFLDPKLRELKVLFNLRQGVMDVPFEIYVLEPMLEKVFVGWFGGLTLGMNPFHGYTGDAALLDPTSKDRAAIRISRTGVPWSTATGKKLVWVGREAEPDVVADAMVRDWWLDPDRRALYALDSGGIAGFRGYLTRVAHLAR